jgi:hypothetical protein
MKEPELMPSDRLLGGDATDFERELLESLLSEQPAAHLKLRMQQSLGFSGPGVWATSAKVALSTAAGKVAVALVGVGLVAGGGAVFASYDGAEALFGMDELSQVAEAAAEPALAPVVIEEAVPAVIEALPEPVSTSQLREEIRLLDAARAAVVQRDTEGAAALLRTYAERFPRGSLRREAGILERRNQRPR